MSISQKVFKHRFQRKHWEITIGLGLFVSLLLMAILGPWLFSRDPMALDLSKRFSPPSFVHPFGLDENGSDVLAQIFYGARISVTVSLTVVLISGFIGLMIGTLAAMGGSRIDQVVMRFVDLVFAFPGFLLALGLIAVLGASINNLILALCLTTWTGFARLIRGEILALRGQEFVQAAVAQGASLSRLIFVHLWPNCVGLLCVQATLTASATVISESGLSFLGLGAPITTPTWGALLNSGRKYLFEAPHIALFPGLMIVILILAFNLMGDGLRSHFDPRSSRQ